MNRLSSLLLFCLALSAQGTDNIVGSVKVAQGGVEVRRGTQTIRVHEGLHLLLDDTLLTSADGRLGAILQDGTRLSLGPKSELQISRFVYQPVEGKFGLLLRLARGALCYVSGKIARFASESVSVETPVGVVGLRGTHLAISIEGQ
ncbi:FecR domain-containing protein [uncultured Paludibaculum sp.]|uniref:FecR domain-containing protein n=1 Tax=uncultured Paludibaculum sp. TaxID=1765020 RepID=UPI002AAB430D|nr:FecR domain-containing protein [uncultured Paludibaculum sp.]